MHVVTPVEMTHGPGNPPTVHLMTAVWTMAFSRSLAMLLTKAIPD